MQNRLSFDDICKLIVDDYINTIHYPKFQINIKLTSDMHQSYLELCSNQSKRGIDGKVLNDYNGLMVAPKELDGIFTILINVNKLREYLEQNNPTWIGTIVHETTHVIDYIEYAKIVGAKNYDEIQLINKHGMFNLWTEFNARSKGYYFLRKYTYDDMHDEDLVPDIINRELPAQTQMLLENYNSTNDAYMQAYYVSHYLGRLYALQKIFPQHFNDQRIKAILNENHWMYEWFKFFNSHTSINDAYRDFGDMKNILRKNFCDL